MDADTREVARDQELVQFDRSCDGLDEDDDLGKDASASAAYLATRGTYLVELEGIKELVELPVLPDFLQLDVVLLETVQGEHRLVVYEDLEGLQPSIHEQRSIHRSEALTLAMNFLHVTRISFANVALNIITCLWCGVARKIS